MKMTNKEYAEYVAKKSPPSRITVNFFRAFLVGGIICCVGQMIMELYKGAGLEEKNAATATTITMVFIGAFLTGLGVYDNIAKFGGGGTLVPITGFANAVVSPALEFKSEGVITGMSAKIFVISGPVFVFGISASVIYGLLLAIFS